jgi:hypothetical protein
VKTERLLRRLLLLLLLLMMMMGRRMFMMLLVAVMMLLLFVRRSVPSCRVSGDMIVVTVSVIFASVAVTGVAGTVSVAVVVSIVPATSRRRQLAPAFLAVLVSAPLHVLADRSAALPVAWLCWLGFGGEGGGGGDEGVAATEDLHAVSL